ncbi:hypothetical protein [Mesorhizobium silamurunense]|uniref:hypothetical protein n=1 Tax=Mesorhizobium silamurunense TaxID=499528 RepID=UPI001786D838|nr:hypothetical protein [Mesorhizobium silamurunense]
MPNTHVPAAGEAMPAAQPTIIVGRFSRRALLGAIASVPAVGTAAAALPSAGTDDHVMSLLRQWQGLNASIDDDMPDERSRIFDAMAVIEATMLAAPARTPVEFAAQYLVSGILDVEQTSLYVHALALTGARS